MKKLSLSLFSIILFSSIISSAISFEKIIIGKANVTDGDTIKINDQKIRLFGIDAPETKQFCKEVYLSFLIFNFKRDYKCGEKSTIALKKKIQGKNVSSRNVLPFSIALSSEKVCGGENGGSGGGKLCKPTLVISLSLSQAEQ